MSKVLLSCKDLSICRGPIEIVSRITFSVAEKEIFHIKGPNGSGKTTLFKAILGMLPPSFGHIELKGNISCYNSQDALKPLLTVKDNMNLFKTFKSFETHFFNKLCEDFEITSLMHMKVSSLSQGERVRVALVISLMDSKPLWVLDEPFSHLDTYFKETLKTLMEDHLTTGGAVIFTSHDPVAFTMLKVYDLGASQGELAA